MKFFYLKLIDNLLEQVHNIIKLDKILEKQHQAKFTK